MGNPALSRFVKSACVAVVSASLSLGAIAAANQDPVKVAFVYAGPTGDAGWTHSHDRGRLYLEQQLGDRVETTYVESVGEGAESERVIRKLAKTGHNLIFTTSFGYMNPTLTVAEAFPKVAFEQASGYKRSANVGTYFDRIYEGRYLTGIIAGKMTKSNIVGYIGSMPIPEVVRGINAFTQGFRSVNPEAQVKVVWVNSWYDPDMERAAAEALIERGADIINQHTDSAAPIQVAEEKGVYAFGYHSDMSMFGKNAHLTAAVHNWGPLYLAKTQAVINDEWNARDVWAGLESAGTDLAPYNKVIPKEVVQLVELKKSAIAAGLLHPFTGPIKDQKGRTRIAKGSVMSDAELLSFDWYVEGVEGDLPH